MKHVLLVAYEYPGYHSRSGAALARRVKQVAESFACEGWRVTVIHKDQTGENSVSPFAVTVESASITRISVKANKAEFAFFDRSVIRRLSTLYYLLKRGDRSFRWANDVKKNAAGFQLAQPDLIISFFTPRGPLFLGSYFAKKFGIPWVADLQDELDQGILSSNKYFARLNCYLSHLWTRKTLRSASAVVQVSPEWAKVDSAILGKEVRCIRHAVAAGATDVYSTDSSLEFQVFYGGSIELANQELATLNTVLMNARTHKPLKLVVAGGETAYRTFRDNLDKSIDIEYVGWLDAEGYTRMVRRSHCCLIVPWSGTGRQAIPSKFYEVCTMRPVWIVGRDSGAFESLVKDLKHPVAEYGDVPFNIAALEKAVVGDYSAMFTLDKCGVAPVTDRQLCGHYLRVLD